MALTKDNFILVYQLGNLDSVDFATYYASKHDMDTVSGDTSANSGSIGGINWQVDGQLLGIELTDNSEILSSEGIFNTQVLNPIENALQNSTEILSRNIYGIVLGYKIPGGFNSGSDIISSTSRVSRANHAFSKKINNKLYNRSIFQSFSADDSNFALVCSRIDAPNLQAAKTYVDNAEVLNLQLFANGTFYIDPYSDRHVTGADDYQQSIIDFKNNLLPTLNLSIWSTTFTDPYIDPAIPYVENDSFIWSWFTDRATNSFFQISNALRIFFYNADYDGGYTVRDDNGKTWAHLALDAGYVATAGSMSNPSAEGFLNPTAFFDALLRGATMGEALLFSVPFLDWTVSFFGDPITTCNFPSAEPVEEAVTGEHAVWEIMSKDLARSVAHLYKKEQEMRSMIDEIVDITTEDTSMDDIDTDMAVSLLYPGNFLYRNNTQIEWKSEMKNLVDSFFDFPQRRYESFGNTTQSPTVNDYLVDQGFKVSRLLTIVSSEAIITSDNLLDEGWWQFEFTVRDDDVSSFINYHFLLDVDTTNSFSSNILISKDSIGVRNWTYEKEKDVFVPITSNGVSSSYIGRRVRYESRVDSLIGINEYLTRGETYYFRVRQYNLETSGIYSPRVFTDIIYT